MHYELDGDIRERIDWRNTAQVECYEHDDLHQLTKAFTSDDISNTTQDCTNGYQTVGTGSYDHTYDYNSIANLTTVDANTWTYGAGTAGAHALTSVGSDSFSYDDAGRQTSRTISSTTTDLTWTPTGMISTHKTGSDETVFVYDADDNRVLRIDPDTTVNTTIGGYWETDGTTDTSYYTFGGGVIGVRNDDGTTDELTYLITDQLSTNTVGYNHTTGGTITRSWYDPWATSGLTAAPPLVEARGRSSGIQAYQSFSRTAAASRTAS